MKASKLGWIVGAMILATTIGCGKNGDPGAGKYDNLKAQTTVSATPGVPTAQPEQPTPVVQQAPAAFDCSRPVDVTVEKDAANKLLVFTVGTESTYKINVHSNLGTEFKIDAVASDTNFNNDLHAGRAKFTQVSKSGTNAVYALTWKPSNQKSDDATFLPLTLKFTNTGADAKCDVKANAGVSLAVQPAKTGDR